VSQSAYRQRIGSFSHHTGYRYEGASSLVNCSERFTPQARANAPGDITRQQLHNLIAGRSRVTPEMAVKLEKALGSTADTWLKMQMNYDLAQVRKRAINIKRFVPA
jgi:addiction module HigA family antidote